MGQGRMHFVAPWKSCVAVSLRSCGPGGMAPRSRCVEQRVKSIEQYGPSTQTL